MRTRYNVDNNFKRKAFIENIVAKYYQKLCAPSTFNLSFGLGNHTVEKNLGNNFYKTIYNYFLLLFVAEGN